MAASQTAGEGAAKLAHGHKNAVHSLRGFLSLIEPKLVGSELSSTMLENDWSAAARRLDSAVEGSLRASNSEGMPGWSSRKS